MAPKTLGVRASGNGAQVGFGRPCDALRSHIQELAPHFAYARAYVYIYIYIYIRVYGNYIAMQAIEGLFFGVREAHFTRRGGRASSALGDPRALGGHGMYMGLGFRV